MKKEGISLKNLIVLPFLVMMMAACGHEEKEVVQPQKPKQTADVGETAKSPTQKVEKDTKQPSKPNKNVASPHKETKADFQSIIPKNWGITLPTQFPVAKGNYVTAIASSTDRKATFTFYEASKPLEVNDPSIKKAGKFLGHLVVTRYNSEKAAGAEIDRSVFKDGEAVDLGHGITGYQDGGAGSLFTSWNEGRWAIIARSTTEKPEESLSTAKNTVEYLETHRMPIPKQNGHLHVDANHTGSLASWQKHNIVYTLTDFKDLTLPWLVTFK